jgi:hypothetical protein
VRAYLRDVLAAGEAEKRLELRRRWHAGRGTVPKITSPPLIAIPPFTPPPASPPADTGRSRADEWRALQSVWRSSTGQALDRLLPALEDLRHSRWPDIRQHAARTLAVLRARPQFEAAWPASWPDALQPLTFRILLAPWTETEERRAEVGDTFFGPLGSMFEINDFSRQLKSLLPEVDPGHVDRTIQWLQRHSSPSQASRKHDPDFPVSASGRGGDGQASGGGFPWGVIAMILFGVLNGSRILTYFTRPSRSTASVRTVEQPRTTWTPPAPSANSTPPRVIQPGSDVPPDLSAGAEFNTNPEPLAVQLNYEKLQQDVKVLQGLVAIQPLADRKAPDFQANMDRSVQQVERRIRAAMVSHPPDSEWGTKYALLLQKCLALRQMIDRP